MYTESWHCKRIDLELARVHDKLSFFAINPLNVEVEQKKFFQSKTYNPKFTYAPYRENLTKLQAKLKKLTPPDTPMGRLLSEQIRFYHNLATLLAVRGNEHAFTQASQATYGIPDKELVAAAKKLVRLPKSQEKEVHTSKHVMQKMRSAFVRYGFDWRIKEKEMVARAAVNCTDRVVLVKKGAKYSDTIIKRLIVHELGTHVLRYENGRKQPYKIFQLGFPGYLKTEEGIAVVNEELNGCLSREALRSYAGRVLAIHYALKYSFRKTYEKLQAYFPKEVAFRLTLRAKRGLSNTKCKGACTKDMLYLKGYLEVKTYLADGGDLDKLYYGKIGVEHAALMDQIPGTIHPYYLPTFRYVMYMIKHFSTLCKSVLLLGLMPLVFLQPVTNLLTPLTSYLATRKSLAALQSAIEPVKKHLVKHEQKLKAIIKQPTLKSVMMLFF